MTTLHTNNGKNFVQLSRGFVQVNIENSEVTLEDTQSDCGWGLGTFSVDRVFLHTPSHQGLQDFSGIENKDARNIIEQIDRDIPGSIHLVEMDSPVAFTLWMDMGVAVANGDYPANAGRVLTRNGRDVRCEPLCIETSWATDKTWNEYGEEMTAADFVAAAREMVGL